MSVEYFAYDGLGSVRQVLDGVGSPLMTQTFNPYGNPYAYAGPTESVTSYGYSGEQTDSNGLVFLRARYYAPSMGRFMQMDPSRQEQNPYSYSYNNPINFTDPSGLESQSPVDSDDRDLTDWLIRQLEANLSDPEVPYMYGWNRLARNTANRINSTSNADCSLALLVIEYKRYAYGTWIPLVKDRARYDYKHAIKAKMGEAIRLCYGAECEWLDYSTPGNINYGYIGRAAGFTSFELHSGASYAEICDPAHNGVGPACPVDGTGYFNTNWALTAFDDPTDYAAVQMGIDLYSLNATRVDRADFERLLRKYLPSLAHGARPYVGYRNLVYGTRYPVGYFDGPEGSFVHTR